MWTPHPLSRPSEQIRILYIAKGAGQTPKLSTEIVDLDSNPSFCALSYAWGPPDEGYPIHINNEVYLVRENLYHVLLQFAEEGLELPLWIDAISIDQHGDEEKSAQVPMMGKIYAQARRTICWLGPIPQDSTFELSTENTPYMMFMWDPSDMTNTGTRLLEIARRPYWGRMWTIQERLLSKDVQLQYGPLRFDWHYFMDCLTTYKTMLIDQVNHNHSLSDVSRHEAYAEIHGLAVEVSELHVISKHMSDRASLFRLVSLSKIFSCEKKHDRIYAMYGLVGECCTSAVGAVDYDAEYLELVRELFIHTYVCRCESHYAEGSRVGPLHPTQFLDACDDGTDVFKAFAQSLGCHEMKGSHDQREWKGSPAEIYSRFVYFRTENRTCN